MSINNIDELLSGFSYPFIFYKYGATAEATSVPYNLMYYDGMPGKMIAPTSGITGWSLDTYSGQIPFNNPTAGKTTYLTRFAGTSSTVGTYILFDRLWHNSGMSVTATTGWTINSCEWPARCPNATGGSTPNTSGYGVMVAIEVSTATTNGSAVSNTTMTYTNSDGISGRTARIASFPATAVANTFVPFLLASGDKGVKSIETLTLGTSYGGGAIHLVAYRPVARLDMPVAYAGNSMDFLSLGMPVWYNNSVPMVFFLPSSTSATIFWGQVQFAQG